VLSAVAYTSNKTEPITVRENITQIIKDPENLPEGYIPEVQPHARKLLPRYYANFCIDSGADYYNYTDLSWEANNISEYELGKVLGKGGFGVVYKGIKDDKAWAVKVLTHNKTHRLRREVKVMNNLKGSPYVIEIADMIKDTNNETIMGYTMEHLRMEDVQHLSNWFRDWELRFVTYQILLGLDFAHSRGIMHRDIKPANIAIDPRTLKVTILDWGLSDFYIPKKRYDPDTGTLKYKAPEQYLGYPYLDYSMDMWSMGCTFASMLFDMLPFYTGSDNFAQLKQINKHLGSVGLLNLMDKYNMTWKYNKTLKSEPGIPWENYVTPKNAHKVNDDAIDLVSKMLSYDFNLRITANEALEHPYFAPVKEYLAKQSSGQPRATQNKILGEAVSLGLTRMSVRQKTTHTRKIFNEILSHHYKE
jgi:casein kinase II subunit alpha